MKTDVINNTGTTLRMSLKTFDKNNLPHELLLSKRPGNAFNENLSTGLRLSKSQISKIIQSGGFLESLLSKLAGPVIKVAFHLTKMF